MVEGPSEMQSFHCRSTTTTSPPRAFRSRVGLSCTISLTCKYAEGHAGEGGEAVVGRDLPRVNSRYPPVAACPGSCQAIGAWHTGGCPVLGTRGCWPAPGRGLPPWGGLAAQGGVGCMVTCLCAGSLMRCFLNLAPCLFQEAHEVMNELCSGTCRESLKRPLVSETFSFPA